jgi:hypothetical protein
MKLLICLNLVFLSLVQAKTIDLTNQLEGRELLATQYASVVKDMTDLKRRQALTKWVAAMLADEKLGKYQLQGIAGGVHKDGGALKGAINNDLVPHQVWRNLMAHYFLTGQSELFGQAIETYLLQQALLVQEWAKDPLVSQRLRDSAQSAFAKVNLKELKKVGECTEGFKTKYDVIDNVESCFSKFSAWKAVSAVIKKQWQEGAESLPLFVKSPVGFVEGNKTEALTLNTASAAIIDKVGKWNKVFQDENPNLNDTQFAEKMKGKSAKQIAEEFYPSLPAVHPVYEVQNGQKRDIFSNVWNSIEAAQESIFIDIFFIGGAMGVSLAKKLMEKA